MGDLYSELLVKRDKTAKDSLTKYGLIVLTALAAFAGTLYQPDHTDCGDRSGNRMLFCDSENRCRV